MSDIRITKKGNMVVDGEKYVARTNEKHDCEGCAFDKDDPSIYKPCQEAPCLLGTRTNPAWKHTGKEVIFVKKEARNELRGS